MPYIVWFNSDTNTIIVLRDNCKDSLTSQPLDRLCFWMILNLICTCCAIASVSVMKAQNLSYARTLHAVETYL